MRTTLGPRGSDKLIVNNNGNATISNDGATIMKMLDVVHPAARTLVDIAKSQDAEVSYLYLVHLFFIFIPNRVSSLYLVHPFLYPIK